MSEPVTLRLSAATLSQVDHLRGRKTRQAYLASLLAVVVAAAAEEEARRQQAGAKIEEPCPHPAARVHKGLCHSCGRNISQPKQ